MAALVLYRTGIVRVTPRMTSLALMGGFGILVVAFLSLIGLSVPGVNELTGAGLVFSMLALGRGAQSLHRLPLHHPGGGRGVSAAGEWPAAFAMMTALVLVYISMLRILGAANGGGGRHR